MISAIRTLKARPVVELDAWRAGRQQAQQLLAEAQRRQPDLAELDPVHGLYAFAQNQLADLIEQLIELPALAKLADAYAEAQDE